MLSNDYAIQLYNNRTFSDVDIHVIPLMKLRQRTEFKADIAGIVISSHKDSPCSWCEFNTNACISRSSSKQAVIRTDNTIQTKL
ncbi:MAG: hypothetical protein DBY37_03390 [Desulfovibrionaceae bacterium]|nr:MAG: hypothetical protein DBY37_03390 [Desulfovibrionaceae bacterium]